MNPPFTVKVGSDLSMRVTEVTNYFGVLEITGVDTATWVEGASDQDVYLEDHRDLAADDVNRLVRITGTLTSAGISRGASGELCYEFSSTELVTSLCTAAPFIQEGTCLTFAGSVNLWNGAVELSVPNYSWISVH